MRRPFRSVGRRTTVFPLTSSDFDSITCSIKNRLKIKEKNFSLETPQKWENRSEHLHTERTSSIFSFNWLFQDDEIRVWVKRQNSYSYDIEVVLNFRWIEFLLYFTAKSWFFPLIEKRSKQSVRRKSRRWWSCDLFCFLFGRKTEITFKIFSSGPGLRSFVSFCWIKLSKNKFFSWTPARSARSIWSNKPSRSVESSWIERNFSQTGWSKSLRTNFPWSISVWILSRHFSVKSWSLKYLSELFDETLFDMFTIRTI